MWRVLICALTLGVGPLAHAQETETEGLEIWGNIYEILSHPRCSNCHVGEDNRPRWSGPSYEAAYGLEAGGSTYHGMNINAGTDRIGVMTLPCGTCHQKENAELPHGPPGAHVWALAPVEMEWFGKSSAEICAQIKDPARNGGRSIADVAAHIDHDELVHWGWDPGPGREPAPYSRKDAVGMFSAWADAGAPCPTNDAVDYLQSLEEGNP